MFSVEAAFSAGGPPAREPGRLLDADPGLGTAPEPDPEPDPALEDDRFAVVGVGVDSKDTRCCRSLLGVDVGREEEVVSDAE